MQCNVGLILKIVAVPSVLFGLFALFIMKDLSSVDIAVLVLMYLGVLAFGLLAASHASKEDNR